MKLIAILTTLAVGGLASVQAQHHAPAPATLNANINSGIKSPTSSNINIEGVASITDEATERKLHDMLTSVKDVMDENYGLDLIDALGGSGRRLSKSHKSDKGIDIIEEVFLLIVLLLVEFLGLGGGGYDTSMLDGLLGGAGEEEDDIADDITAAHHGHDGPSSKTAKSEGTDGSAKSSKESKSSKSGGGPLCVSPPAPVGFGQACCTNTDCAVGVCMLPPTERRCGISNSDIIDCSASAGNSCTLSDGCTGAGESCFAGITDRCTPETNPGGICQAGGR